MTDATQPFCGRRAVEAPRLAVLTCALFALSGCTTAVGSLDTALLDVSPAQSEASFTDLSDGAPPLRPAIGLDGPATSTAPGAVNALAPAVVADAAQTTSQVVADAQQADAETDFPEVPSPAQAVAEARVVQPAGITQEADAVANARIAQANNVSTQVTPEPIVTANAALAEPTLPTSTSAGLETAALATNERQTSSQSGFFNRLFGRNNNNPRPPAPVVQEPSSAVVAASALAQTPQTASSPAVPRPTVQVRAASTAGLPGVNRERVLGIESDDGSADDTTPTRPVQVASAAGLARLAPNGLRTQHAGVDVACLKPALVRVLKQTERKFGKPVVVTSGYRSPNRNANARGAKNSLHMYCAAADIQIEGVSKWELAAYLRSVPGRGGIGTYCHTKSVHVDIGPRRDWNWRCRRG